MRTAVSVKRLSERSRLKSLHTYHILDTVSEVEYDNITKIAAGICNVPVSLMTLMDRDRQWFKSRHGFHITELPREISFCNYLMNDPDQVLVVPDLRQDERFAGNPLVSGDPHVVFYAAAALKDPQGQMMGSICVYDQKINHLDENQQTALAALAQQVMNSLELRKKMMELRKVQQQLRKVNRNLKQFAHVVSHDLKTPLASISMLSKAVEDSDDNALHDHNRSLLTLINKNAAHLQNFVDEVLSVSCKTAAVRTTLADTGKIIDKVIRLIGPGDEVAVQVQEPLPKLAISKIALQQVMQNLITNAIKYNDKANVIIDIRGHSCERYHHVCVTDNGTGIPKQQLQRIFEEHRTLDQTDRFGQKGSGIGLSTVKRLLTEVGGNVRADSSLQKGSAFTISVPINHARKHI